MSEQTSVAIANAFCREARRQSQRGDIIGAIESLRLIEYTRDLPEGYRRDAREIMDLLLLDYFNQQRARI